MQVREEENQEGWVNLTINAATEDMGTIIGKGGSVIKSLQNIVKIKAIKEDKGVNVEVEENRNY